MKYATNVPGEVQKAREYLEQLIKEKRIVEVKKVSPKRSLNQNNYLHLLLSAFGMHFGYTDEEAKLIYKEINRETYYYTKKGRAFLRSSSDLSKEEMAKTIDVLHRKSAEQGYALPPATDPNWLRQIENEIERSKHYL